MNSLSADDQALLEKCKTKLNCDDYAQCLLVPTTELQRITGLSSTQTQHARHLLSIATYNWRTHLQPASTLHSADQYISTGDSQIDLCFSGGIRQQSITEIVGESASGKTQLCLQLSATALLNNPQSMVIYIATEGAFPTGRLASMLVSRCSESVANDAMRRMQVAEFDDMQTLFHAMEYKLPALLGSNNVSLVVVDSIAAHLRFSDTAGVSEQTGFYKQRSVQLVSLGAKLKLWATKYKCAIICTNQVKDIINDDNKPSLVSASSTEISTGDDEFSAIAGGGKAPALGSVWANIIDARIMMYQRRGLVLPDDELRRPDTMESTVGRVDGQQVDPPRHLMRTRRWLENQFSPWAPRAQCEVVLDEAGFHHV
ncbi:DNA repair protein rhp57 [Coemansia sp. RSA 486]|nr:DNA repair protein rhp57 [Coemansia sp. RSA 486]KAJ2234682.1 DNA repair protein rhp57 [Coemansia sp. RSA 485]KAJ2599708.1 DNA repair protein rhp57 [Coemansia sp. RSA 1721]KAJ2637695.1 DNA repair protein rhp57 [Coemansia sp. RSA 1286]